MNDEGGGAKLEFTETELDVFGPLNHHDNALCMWYRYSRYPVDMLGDNDKRSHGGDDVTVLMRSGSATSRHVIYWHAIDRWTDDVTIADCHRNG